MLLASCGGDATAPPIVARVEVAPAVDSIHAIGGEAQYQARVEREDGTEILEVAVAWSVTNPSVASVDAISGLTLALSKGTTEVRASAGGVTGSASLVVDPRPTAIVISGGDDQAGPPGEPLPMPVEVEVRDDGGIPVPGVQVTFSVVEGGGSAGGSTTTNAFGRASTEWILGVEGPQRLVAGAGGGPSVEFRATADATFVVVVEPGLVNAHLGVPYHALLEARGGTGPYQWSLVEGQPPSGIALGEDGRLTGEAAGTGLFTFTVKAQPSAGTVGVRTLRMRACSPSSPPPGGGVLLATPASPGDCGLFLWAGAGHRYRVAVVRLDVGQPPDATNVETVTMRVTSYMAAPEPTLVLPAVVGPSSQRMAPEDHPQRTMPPDGGVRLAEQRLMERYGATVEVLTSRQARLQAQPPARFAYDPPRDLSACVDHADRAALLVAQNDNVAVYQDSIQRQSFPVSGSAVQKMLAFYAAHGHGAVVDYTGGLPDVNGDGALVVVATSELPSLTAALVWSGDLLSAQSCPGSNQMEVVYLDTELINEIEENDSDFNGVATLVHEAKHVASFHHRLRNFARTGIPNPFHPPWIEEGTAEIVAEAASRRAWASMGGPPIDYPVTKEDLVASGRTPENAQTFLSIERAARYLRAQPNAVTVAPVGGEPTYAIYGSGWQFHRFLADAYASPGSGVAFFRAQNDSLTAAGIGGLEALTGRDFPDLVEAYAVALMLNGTGTVSAAPGFLTYDFASATDGVANGALGSFPWPVTGPVPRPFATATFSGPMGETGLRIHDFTSDGTPYGIEIHVDVPAPASLIVVRLH